MYKVVFPRRKGVQENTWERKTMVRAPGNQCGIQKAWPELRLQSTCEQERKMRSGDPHWGRQAEEGA